MTVFAGAGIRRPLYAVVHVFDPSYSGDATVCVCSLPKDADIHATPLGLGVSKSAGGVRT